MPTDDPKVPGKGKHSIAYKAAGRNRPPVSVRTAQERRAAGPTPLTQDQFFGLIAAKTGLRKSEAAAAVRAYEAVAVEELFRTGRLRLLRLGGLFLHHRAARPGGRSIWRDGKEVPLLPRPARVRLKFAVSKVLKRKTSRDLTPAEWEVLELDALGRKLVTPRKDKNKSV